MVASNERSRGDRPVTSRTKKDGGFSVSLSHSAPSTVRVVAEGYAPWVEKRVRPGTVLEVTLLQGLSLAGIVMDLTRNRFILTNGAPHASDWVHLPGV